jgi:recombination protein RecA
MAKKPKKAGKKKSAKQEQDELIDDMVEALVAIGGEGTAQVLGSDAAAIKIKGVISTQCPALDKAIGRGGIPLSRLTILHGPEMSGKTTLCLHIVAETQRRGGIVVYIDKEYKLDPDYATAIGVDIKRLIISQPAHLERAYEIIDGVAMLAKKWREMSGVFVPVLAVVDSINSAITKAQFEGDFDDKFIAAQARVHSEHLPKVIPKISRESVALLFVAQNRSKIGKMFGDPDEISGGHAVRYYASLIIKVQSIGDVKEGDIKKAKKTLAECRKNQIAAPFGKAEFEIRHGVGIDQMAGLIGQAIDLKVLKPSMKNGKKTSWWVFRGNKIANGRGQLREQINEDDELRIEVMEDIQAAMDDKAGAIETTVSKKSKKALSDGD